MVPNETLERAQELVTIISEAELITIQTLCNDEPKPFTQSFEWNE